ncbi:serine/threonine-protein kinase BRI1-like 2 [Mangifera indica]|uniref:serine/threonine-protein kinase BRI1-like 2 n=1 Tax=Mangifera indica TaxID=29780 RepID=UPI001CFA70B6|nr:serine/threonine-protein kinase BRI1-like 2 [Mangifera indica]
MTPRNLTTDRSALLAFKSHVVAPYNILTFNWSISAPVCTWGNIPSGIGKLMNLKESYLGNNNLTGPIPEGIYNISSLRTVDLNSNSLSGSLPEDLCSRFPKLERLFLSSNGLTGRLPPSLGDCTELIGLLAPSNHFTGAIPESIGNLTGLLG